MHNLNPVSNNEIKRIIKLHQKKYREESGFFIAEGIKPLEEILSNNIETVEIFALKNTDISWIKEPVKIIDESVMNKISTTNTPVEILTIAKKINFDLNLLPRLNKIILLDSISDPGNLGTIIRSSSAFGCEGIILYNNCVDIFSSKVVRSAAGNLFKTPFFFIKDIEELKNIAQKYKLVSTSLSRNNNISLEKCSNINKYIIMFGSEAKGLSTELIQIAENNIKINMAKNVESLNLSVCVSIVLYELFKNQH